MTLYMSRIAKIDKMSITPVVLCHNAD